MILVLYSGLTFSRNLDWKDRVTLFRHDIKVVENSAPKTRIAAPFGCASHKERLGALVAAVADRFGPARREIAVRDCRRPAGSEASSERFVRAFWRYAL